MLHIPKPKKDPKVGQDPMIFTSSCTPPLTGCRSPKIGHYDQESPKTWSRANIPRISRRMRKGVTHDRKCAVNNGSAEK
jgi:hypothetical protein